VKERAAPCAALSRCAARAPGAPRPFHQDRRL